MLKFVFKHPFLSTIGVLAVCDCVTNCVRYITGYRSTDEIIRFTNSIMDKEQRSNTAKKDLEAAEYD